jgi:hypothetical protein
MHLKKRRWLEVKNKCYPFQRLDTAPSDRETEHRKEQSRHQSKRRIVESCEPETGDEDNRLGYSQPSDRDLRKLRDNNT